jgi:hypothetical protein
VAFTSDATNLVRGDTNGLTDVFVRDRQAGQTTRVSVSSGQVQATGGNSNFRAAISADGRFVAFESAATNLVSGDSNDVPDVFMRDRASASTTRLSLSTSGVQANDGGRFPAISGDGRFVAFESDASNLVAGDSNSAQDIFLRDRGAFRGFSGAWERVTLRCAPRQRPQRCTVGGRLAITNPGNRTATASRVYFFVSKNRKLDARDRLVKKLRLGRLRGGTTRTVNLKRRLGRDVSGRFLIAKLDATDKVKEPNEKDNVVVSEPLSRKRIRLRINGRARRSARSSIRVTVTNSRGRALRNARVSISSAGLERITKRTSRRGRAGFRLPPVGNSTLKVVASRRGYATTTVYRKAR